MEDLTSNVAFGHRICAVIVTFYPDTDRFSALLESLAEQCDCLVIVDNTPSHDLPEIIAHSAGSVGVHVIRSGRNTGIAAAFNRGAEWAFSNGFTEVLLSDQDSLPDSDMVSVLTQTLDQLRALGLRIAAVGPTYREQNQGTTAPFIVYDGFLYRRVCPPKERPNIRVTSLISSGMMIPFESWRTIGGMDESLFIDLVDTEWCMRARHMGFELYGTGRTGMNHRIGDRPLRYLLDGWRSITEHGPMRLQYQFRNWVLLWMRSQVPLTWKLDSLISRFVRFYAYALFSPRRLESVRYILKGLRDGLLGRSGPITPNEG